MVRDIKNVIVADFETTNYLTNDKETWVWLWSTFNIYTGEIKTGYDINSFMSFVLDQVNNTDIYFHNLKFDIEFILPWLLNNKFDCMPFGGALKPKTFNMIVTELGQFYCCNVQFKKGLKINFKDSLKLIPMKVKDIPKAFGLDVTKGDCDHNKIRNKPYKPTDEEIDYCIRDTVVVGKALKTFLDEGLTKLTIGSNSLWAFKESLVEVHKDNKMRKRAIENKFRHFFPSLDNEEFSFTQNSYYGGLSYVNPKYKNKNIGSGIVLDVNSMYPNIMVNEYLPFSKGKKFLGMPEKDDIYNLYIVEVDVVCKVKDNKIPCIMIGSKMLKNQFLEDTHDEYEHLFLTNIDIEMLFENYEVFDIIYHGGYKYKSKKGLFDKYILHHYKMKSEYKKLGKLALSTISKLYINSLYGKFGSKNIGVLKLCFIDENGVIHYKDDEETEKETVYMPVACFVTALARRMLVNAINNNYNRFLYCDTDSVHLLGLDIPEDLEMDKFKLGAWDNEMAFSKAKYLRQKCYIEVEEIKKSKSVTLDNFTFNVSHIKVAGATPENKKYINLNNFHYNLVVSEGKTRVKRVKGGIILVPTTFELKGE